MKDKIVGIFITIVACIFSLTLSACSERVSFPETAISLGLSLNFNGEITQELQFSAQTEHMKKLSIKEEAINEVHNNLISAVKALRNEFYISLLVVYSTSPNENYKIGDAVKVSEVVFDEEFDVVHFVMIYRDTQTWQFYHGGESSDNPLENKDSIKFFEKTSSKSAFPFAAKYTQASGKEITVGERYLNLYNTAFNLTLDNSMCAKLLKPKFVYDYSTPFASLRSNAELCLQSNGLYHNVWIKDVNNFKDAEVILTSTTIYSGWWYLSLLVTIILALLICLIIFKVKNQVKIKRLS